MKKTTVIYHRADFDGLFCREIARKFLPGAELIGWDGGGGHRGACGMLMKNLPFLV